MYISPSEVKYHDTLVLFYHETEGTETTLGLFMRVVCSGKKEEL